MKAARSHPWRQQFFGAGPPPRFTPATLEVIKRRAKAAGYTLRRQGGAVLLVRFGASTEIESLGQVDRILGDAP